VWWFFCTDVLFNFLIRTVVLLAEMFLKVDKFIE